MGLLQSSSPMVANSQALFPLVASQNNRYLTSPNGTPFFMVGDGTAQPLAVQSIANVSLFLNIRASQGFNTLWIHVVLNQQDGGYNNGATYDGIAPFTGTLDGTTVDGGPNYDFTTPNPSYFARLDQILTMCAQAGFVVFLDNMENDSYLAVYENNGVTRMAAFAAYIGQRYAGFPNVVWMTGNDFQTWNTSSLDNNIAQALMAGTNAVSPMKLQTVELNYNISGGLDNSLLAPYITVTPAYTYYPVYYEVGQEYASGVKTVPVYTVETYYEGVSYGDLSPNSIDRIGLRKVPWWTTLSGGLAGYFYGSIQVLGPWTGTWQTNLYTAAVADLLIWKQFFQSFGWQNLVPDSSNVVCTAGFGTATGNGTGNIETDNYCTTARIADGSKVITYSPEGATLTIAMTAMRGTTTARWFDPTNGAYTAIGSYPNTGTQNFTTPGNNNAGNPDWVLRLDA